VRLLNSCSNTPCIYYDTHDLVSNTYGDCELCDNVLSLRLMLSLPEGVCIWISTKCWAVLVFLIQNSVCRNRSTLALSADPQKLSVITSFPLLLVYKPLAMPDSIVTTKSKRQYRQFSADIIRHFPINSLPLAVVSGLTTVLVVQHLLLLRKGRCISVA